MSKRLVINELVAYLDLAALPAALLIDCDPAQQSQPATLIDSAFTMVLHVAQVDLSL